LGEAEYFRKCPLLGLLVSCPLREGAVDVDVLQIWTIPIIVGVVIGIICASFAKPILFKVVFIVVSKRQIEVALSVYLMLISLRFFASLN
jgi:uncharacterized membrane protein YfcA